MRLLLVGDTHGNVAWLERVVFAAAERHQVDRIVQVGDFGWWPGMRNNDAFREAARRSPAPLWWIDGNHEDHARLLADVAAAGGSGAGGVVSLGGALSYVPRGARFVAGGVSILACGGAHSIDRRARSPGLSWFDQEHVNDADVAACVDAGHADVLIGHDAPAGWAIPHLPPERHLPAAWRAELPACWAHRRQLARVMEGVTPSLVIHGHYHSAYRQSVHMRWGPTEIVGLSEDGTTGSLALLTCTDGMWTVGRP